MEMLQWAAWADQAEDEAASWAPPRRGFPGISHREEAPRQTQDTPEWLYLSAGLGNPGQAGWMEV